MFISENNILFVSFPIWETIYCIFFNQNVDSLSDFYNSKGVSLISKLEILTHKFQRKIDTHMIPYNKLIELIHFIYFVCKSRQLYRNRRTKVIEFGC